MAFLLVALFQQSTNRTAISLGVVLNGTNHIDGTVPGCSEQAAGLEILSITGFFDRC